MVKNLGLKGLLDSRKANVLVLITGLLTTLEEMGRIDPMHYVIAITVITVIWKLAHAYEEAAKARAMGAPPQEVIDAALKAALKADLPKDGKDDAE